MQKAIFCKADDSHEVTSLIFSALRKHAYSNISKISPQETETFQVEILIFFIFLLKT